MKRIGPFLTTRIEKYCSLGEQPSDSYPCLMATSRWYSIPTPRRAPNIIYRPITILTQRRQRLCEPRNQHNMLTYRIYRIRPLAIPSSLPSNINILRSTYQRYSPSDSTSIQTFPHLPDARKLSHHLSLPPPSP